MEAYERLEEIISAIDLKYGEAELDQLPIKDRYMRALFHMELRNQNSGFYGYLADADATYVHTAIEGLLAIGDKTTYENFKTLFGFFPDNKFVDDGEQRWKLMKEWTPEQRSKCDEFDHQYWDTNHDNTLPKAVRYYESH